MSNNFCIMRFEKIKTWNDVQARARHNNRTIPLENTNVNPELAKQNIRGGNIYDPAMIRQHYSNVVKNLKKKPRPDAVKAIEIVATFSNTAKDCLTPDQQKDYSTATNPVPAFPSRDRATIPPRKPARARAFPQPGKPH